MKHIFVQELKKTNVRNFTFPGFKTFKLNDMKHASYKNHLKGRILYQSPNPPKNGVHDIRYPAMIVKIIDRHFTDFMQNPDYKFLHYQLLSNDNGFLTYTPHHFSQRTLTARFQTNATDGFPIATYFIPKAAITVMTPFFIGGTKLLYQI